MGKCMRAPAVDAEQPWCSKARHKRGVEVLSTDECDFEREP